MENYTRKLEADHDPKPSLCGIVLDVQFIRTHRPYPGPVVSRGDYALGALRRGNATGRDIASFRVDSSQRADASYGAGGKVRGGHNSSGKIFVRHYGLNQRSAHGGA